MTEYQDRLLLLPGFWTYNGKDYRVLIVSYGQRGYGAETTVVLNEPVSWGGPPRERPPGTIVALDAEEVRVDVEAVQP